MDDDCAPQQFCAAALFEGAGLWGSGGCETLVPSGTNEGDPCGSPVQCGPGLSCSGGPAPASCGVGPSEGASCGHDGSCASGLACVESDDGSTVACIQPAKLGDPCTALFQCGAQYTLSDIICDETGTHTCVQRRSTGPCVVVGGADTCDPTTSYCAAGTCKPRIPDGAACVFPSSGDNPCGLWSSCAGPTCQPLLGVCIPQ
jgi:hypothetical protein